MNQTAGSTKPAKGCRGLSLFLLVPVLLIVVVLAGEFILTAAGGILIIADPLRESDAIAVLSGGGDMSRVEEGSRLFMEKMGEWLVLTEITPREGDKVTETTTLFKQIAIGEGVPNSSILVTSQAAFSTRQEAVEILNLAQKRGFQSLIIVTDPFHTFRTRLIYRSVFRDSGIDLYVRPVRNHWYRSTTWWATSQGRQATLSEYIKIIAYFSGLESGQIE